MALQLFFLSWVFFTVLFAVVLSKRQIKAAGVLGMLLGLLSSFAALFVCMPLINKIEKIDNPPYQKNPDSHSTQYKKFEKSAENYKSLDVDADEFAQRFNDTVTGVDQNWRITELSERPKGDGDVYGTVKFKPTSKNIGITATVNDDATLREIMIIIGKGETDTDNVRAVLTMLAVAEAVNFTEPKAHVSKVVTGLFQDAMSHPRQASEGTIGKYDYTLNFSPELGGMLFAISDSHAGQD